MEDGQIASMSALASNTTSPPVDPRRSLMVTDQSILASFSFAELMDRIAAGSPTALTKEALFNQWWDTNNKGPGLAQGSHCDDTVDPATGKAMLNGFAIVCARAEGTQITGTPFDTTTGDSYVPIALINRLDLASNPAIGTDCGEYRIVFAKKSGMTDRLNRNLVVFEGVLPNPSPNGKDLSGCVPVAQFWASLTSISDPTLRASKLHAFYFDGLPGFKPVVRADAYGNATPHAKGQVRANQFMQKNWLLRQYSVQVVDSVLRFVMAPMNQNPEGLLFNETITDAKGPDFRAQFVNVVASLAGSDLNRLDMGALPATFNAGDSDEQDAMKTNYANQFASSPNFAASIQAQLTSIGSTLTPADIVARAQAMSCAGCHQLSNSKSLGGGLTWPASLGFVHCTENQTEASPDGPAGSLRYVISPALINQFLPRRKQVIDEFLGGSSSGTLAVRKRLRAK